MTTFAEDLRTYVLADPTIAGLIGTRMYPLEIPQGPTYPCVRYSRVSAIRELYLGGPTGRVHIRMSLMTFAFDYATLTAVADAIRRRLIGFAGVMGASEIGSLVLDNEIDLNEPEVGVYSVNQDFIVSLKET